MRCRSDFARRELKSSRRLQAQSVSRPRAAGTGRGGGGLSVAQAASPAVRGSGRVAGRARLLRLQRAHGREVEHHAARDEGRMTAKEGDLFNHHAAISHSILEDTVLYGAISLPVFWLILPRILLSIIVVWLERLRRELYRRSLKAGVA